MTRDEAEKMADTFASSPAQHKEMIRLILRIADEQWNAALDAAGKKCDDAGCPECCADIIAMKREVK